MRHIITLLLMLPVLADAQIYIDSYRFRKEPVNEPLLNTYSGAVAAYSLRLIDTLYTGDCIVVQRDNGDTSAIGFAGNYLDTAAMKTFCGEGANDTCRVRLWYDQSGNDRYARMDTTRRQPFIMVNGAVIYDGAQVAIQFGDTDSFSKALDIPKKAGFTSNVGYVNVFDVRRVSENTETVTRFAYYISNGTAAGSARVASQKGSSSPFRYGLLGRRLDANSVQTANSSTAHPITRIISSALWNYQSATLRGWIDGVEVATNNTFQTAGNTSNTAPLAALIGNANTLNLPWSGTFQEIIFYQTDQSANRAAIETSINAFYQIY